jgi:hypothetical protein
MDEEKECIWCERSLAIFGILLGAVILFISLDVLTESRLSSLIGQPALPGGGNDD